MLNVTYLASAALKGKGGCVYIPTVGIPNENNDCIVRIIPGLGAISNATTVLAPRSTSISTRRCPTKPEEPVTTQCAGTGGNGARDNFEGSARVSIMTTHVVWNK